MQISSSLKHHLNKKLSLYFGKQIEINRISKMHGGSVNYSYLLKTNAKNFFIKLNDAKRFPKMFELEVLGLQQIDSTNTLETPGLVIEGCHDSIAYLVLELIDTGKETKNFWELFGSQLAKLHKNKHAQFGLNYSNYIGSLPQQNTNSLSWTKFFGEQRLLAQSKLAFDNGRIDLFLLKDIELIIKKLDSLFPDSSPSLLHGDLWSGNFLIGKNEQPVVIDPAIYYGNREMDIAMTLLFGGFNKKFYDSYQNIYPLSPNWEERIDLCNIYPLLVHVNLYGASYAKRLKNVINRYL
jgi:fructosamine-3-kinase